MSEGSGLCADYSSVVRILGAITTDGAQVVYFQSPSPFVVLGSQGIRGQPPPKNSDFWLNLSFPNLIPD
jgi:hypothetical protein